MRETDDTETDSPRYREMCYVALGGIACAAENGFIIKEIK